jgi:hypothetical protein
MIQNSDAKWTYQPATSNHYGIAPFDAKQSLTKLTTWDSPPSETKVEKI